MSNSASQAVASNTVLHADNVNRTYRQGDLSVEVLNGLSLTVEAGERIGIIGSSGSGKSTLLHLLGGLDMPTSGSVTIAGQDLRQLSHAARGRLRNKSVGFIYQFHHLLPEFTAIENVCMPLLIRGVSPKEATRDAAILLDRVGLAERHRHKPSELSGGERQRTAVARALINKPQIVLADEPTGNLDESTAMSVYELMLELNSEMGTSFLIVTHDRKLAGRMQRVLQLTGGKLEALS